jgi:tetratricopeptide (TPR) repeat protein
MPDEACQKDFWGKAMTYFDLGPYSRKVTTSSPDAQLWFDRGLNWLFGFNHGEAIKCFQKALENDPECAMAHWGVSYASGPNYNLPWHLYDPHGRQMALEASYDAMQAALLHAEKAGPLEQAMIHALPARYPERKAIDDMAPWDKAYTNEMRKVFEEYPDDLEVRAVFAQAGRRRGHRGSHRGSGARLRQYPRLVGPPGALAPLRPSDGDVAIPATGVARRRPVARDHAGLGSPDPHAHPYRCPVRVLP